MNQALSSREYDLVYRRWGMESEFLTSTLSGSSVDGSRTTLVQKNRRQIAGKGCRNLKAPTGMFGSRFKCCSCKFQLGQSINGNEAGEVKEDRKAAGKAAWHQNQRDKRTLVAEDGMTGINQMFWS